MTEAVNALICAAYIISFFFYRKKLDFYACALAFVLILNIPVADNAVPAYILFSVIYALLTYYLYWRKNVIVSVACCIMGIYCLYFAYDGWINSDVKTWVWNNHEIIVAFIHSFILLTFSNKFRSLVGTAFNYFSGHNSVRRAGTVDMYSSERRSAQSED